MARRNQGARVELDGCLVIHCFWSLWVLLRCIVAYNTYGHSSNTRDFSQLHPERSSFYFRLNLFFNRTLICGVIDYFSFDQSMKWHFSVGEAQFICFPFSLPRSDFVPIQIWFRTEPPSLSALAAVEAVSNGNRNSVLLGGSGPALHKAAEHAASSHPLVSEVLYAAVWCVIVFWALV
jgi:hypothetical protein